MIEAVILRYFVGSAFDEDPENIHLYAMLIITFIDDAYNIHIIGNITYENMSVSQTCR